MDRGIKLRCARLQIKFKEAYLRAQLHRFDRIPAPYFGVSLQLDLLPGPDVAFGIVQFFQFAKLLSPTES